MYLNWRITDDLSGLTVKEFNEEWNGIYGFMELKIDKDVVGYIPPLNCELEGNENISFWVQNVIECGIALLNNECYKCQLLSLNLLTIYITPKRTVEILLKHEDGHIEWKQELPYYKIYNEIFEVYKRFENEIIEINNLLLETNTLKRINYLFKEYERLYFACRTQRK